MSLLSPFCFFFSSSFFSSFFSSSCNPPSFLLSLFLYNKSTRPPLIRLLSTEATLPSTLSIFQCYHCLVITFSPSPQLVNYPPPLVCTSPSGAIFLPSFCLHLHLFLPLLPLPLPPQIDTGDHRKFVCSCVLFSANCCCLVPMWSCGDPDSRLQPGFAGHDPHSSEQLLSTHGRPLTSSFRRHYHYRHHPRRADHSSVTHTHKSSTLTD